MKKKKRFDKWDVRFILMMAISLITMIVTFIIRTKQGIESWYTTHWFVYALYEIGQTIFLGSIIAYAGYMSYKAFRNKR